jgi:hypothetical protein
MSLPLHRVAAKRKKKRLKCHKASIALRRVAYHPPKSYRILRKGTLGGAEDPFWTRLARGKANIL